MGSIRGLADSVEQIEQPPLRQVAGAVSTAPEPAANAAEQRVHGVLVPAVDTCGLVRSSTSQRSRPSIRRSERTA